MKCSAGGTAVVLAIALSIAPAGAARASCNLIPATTKTFNATLGATNRPFAAPGERVELHTRPCDQPGPLGGITATAAQHVVTVAFQPAVGQRHIFVLAPGTSGCSTLAAQLTTCGQQPGVASVQCLDDGTVPQAGVAIVDRDGIDTLT